LRALTEGVNVSVFLFGATGSGKTHSLEGSNTEPGLANLFADSLFNLLEDKRFKNGGGFQFQIKMKYVEILDEEVRDLLSGGGGFGGSSRNLQVVLNEWEGPTVSGVQWIPMTNQH
jgi:hypothetical protein